jgi:hypothetical protein
MRPEITSSSPCLVGVGIIFIWPTRKLHATGINQGNREKRPINLNVNNAKRTHDDYKPRR